MVSCYGYKHSTSLGPQGPAHVITLRLSGCRRGPVRLDRSAAGSAPRAIEWTEDSADCTRGMLRCCASCRRRFNRSRGGVARASRTRRSSSVSICSRMLCRHVGSSEAASTDRALISQQDRQSNEFTARTDRALSSQQDRQSNEFTARQTEQRVHSKDRQNNGFTARAYRATSSQQG